MNLPGRKMVVHLGEGARIGAHPATDALLSMAADAGVDGAVLLRGVEGFGLSSRLRSDRLLSLSDDLPAVLVAVGRPERVGPLAERASALLPAGLVTLEGVALVPPGGPMPSPTGEGRVTAYCARGPRNGGPPVPLAAVRALRRLGIPGAVVLVGVDGILLGERRRARLASRNRHVPAMVQALAPAPLLARALRVLSGIPGVAMLALEGARVLRRDGVAVAEGPVSGAVPPGDDGLRMRAIVLAPEDAHLGGRPLHAELIRRLWHAGAAGATSLRGEWAFSDDGPLHGDRFLSLRRRAPVVTSVIDSPDAIARVWPTIAEATADAGLVTCEAVPAVRVRPTAAR